MDSKIPGYTVRSLRVHEMRDLNKQREEAGFDPQDASYRMAAVAIEKDGQPLGYDALMNMDWPVFQVLLKEVMRANGVDDDEAAPNA